MHSFVYLGSASVARHHFRALAFQADGWGLNGQAFIDADFLSFDDVSMIIHDECHHADAEPLLYIVKEGCRRGTGQGPLNRAACT